MIEDQEDKHLIYTLFSFSMAFFKMGLCNTNCHSLSGKVVNGCGGGKRCGGGRVERVREEREEGQAVARAVLDEMELYCFGGMQMLRAAI